MGRRTLIFGVLGLGVFAGIGWLLNRQRVSLPRRLSASGNQMISVGDEALVVNPDRYRGKLQVSGIVGRILAEQHLFSLVDISDRDELLRRGVTQCATLPVRWTGPMPAVQDEVLVEGEIEDSNGKLLFVARTVQNPAVKSATGGQK